MKSIKSTLVFLAPYALIVLFFGTTYAAVQQDIRQTGNDPQIALAEDAAPLLAKGIKPADVVAMLAPENGRSIDISTSLTPFIAVYDEQGMPLVSSGSLNGALPTLPAGIFKSVSSGDTIGMGQSHEDRVTWQPEPGTRIALVILPYAGAQSGYVAVGRSLREVENRENALEGIIALGCLASIVIYAIYSFIRARRI